MKKILASITAMIIVVSLAPTSVFGFQSSAGARQESAADDEAPLGAVDHGAGADIQVRLLAAVARQLEGDELSAGDPGVQQLHAEGARSGGEDG